MGRRGTRPRNISKNGHCKFVQLCEGSCLAKHISSFTTNTLQLLEKHFPTSTGWLIRRACTRDPCAERHVGLLPSVVQVLTRIMRSLIGFADKVFGENFDDSVQVVASTAPQLSI